MDDYALIRERQLLKSQSGKILTIALTTDMGKYNQHQALNAGVEQRLSKLANPGEFVQLIVTLN